MSEGSTGGAGGAIAALCLLLLLPLVVVLLFTANQPPPQAGCTAGGQVLSASGVPKGGIGGWGAQSVANAATIINVGAQMGVPARGQMLAVATAMDESSLHNLDYGTSDSLGLFQQRPSQGWGTPAQLLTPSYAARKFYGALLKTHGWQTEPPTVAIHNVQGNADPTVYAQFWTGGGPQIGKRIGAVQLTQAIAKPSGGAAGGSGISAGSPLSATAMATASGCGSSGGFSNAVVTTGPGSYVGRYNQQQLLARVHQLATSGHDWTDQCQAFVAIAEGKSHSGYATAIDAWNTFQSEGTAHPANGPDGHTIPIGAWVYFRTQNPAGHVALYVGNGKVASTDMGANGKYHPGQLNVVPLTAVEQQMNGPYLGWAAPWGQKVKVVPQAQMPSSGLGNVPATTSSSAAGSVTVAQANIPTRSGWGGFKSSMRRVLSTHPDLVSLNEQFARSVPRIEADAPHYKAFRDPRPAGGPGGSQARDEVLLYKSSTWTLLAGGRVFLVRDLEPPEHAGRGVQIRPRFALWGMFQRKSDGAIVSLISTHMPVNPDKFGPDKPKRRREYAQAMSRLTALGSQLAQHGPVLVAGDMNAHPNQMGQFWAPTTVLNAAGMAWYSQDVDYIYYPAGSQLLGSATGHMHSDHPWIAAKIGLS